MPIPTKYLLSHFNTFKLWKLTIELRKKKTKDYFLAALQDVVKE